MFHFAQVTTSLLLATTVSVAAAVVVDKSYITLPISRRINLSSGTTIAQHDAERANILRELGLGIANANFTRRSVVSTPITNTAVSYVASVGVGSPATYYSLIVDTGSSNTWVGAGKAYQRTSTSHIVVGGSSTINYGSGKFSGQEYTDQVTLGPGLVIKNQMIGDANSSVTQGFTGVDGILGLGPVDLTVGTVAGEAIVPTVVDNLHSQGIISGYEIGISMEPTTFIDNTNGEITYGGIDSSKYTGKITYIPITSTSPANKYWGIDQSIKYGSTTLLSTTAGIVDTGTTLILIATNAFRAYQSATGGVMDQSSGLLSITSAQYAKLQDVVFTINGNPFTLTPNAQIFPRSLNTNIGGTAGSIYLIIGDVGSVSGSGLDFINGMSFLERFYSVYDSASRRVGIATTPFTTATSN